MSLKKVCTDILKIQGWEILAHDVRIENESIIVPIRRRKGTGLRCSRCGKGVLFVHDHTTPRKIQDIPWAGYRVFLEASLARVNCPDCGVAVEALDWVDPWSRYTMKFERLIAAFCEILPVTDVAEQFSLNKNAVYRIDRKWLALRAAQREEHPVRYLGIDEIALKRGHRYATVFYDLERAEVIGMVKSRKERAVGGFFRRWGKHQCKQVEAVCMDLWSPFLNSVRRHCKKAEVVFDKFHVYRYFSDAVEQVRRDEQSRLPAEQGKLIKGTRWLWLKSSSSLKRKEKQTLDEIMEQNKNLARAYVLKEDFQGFYECETAEEAEAFFKGWVNRCQRSALMPFRTLARRLKRWLFGILSYFNHRITNGVAEGINNKIKVLKRRAYGFHDDHYFMLKIMQQCGGLPDLDEIIHPHF